jgi:hypothetical protein
MVEKTVGMMVETMVVVKALMKVETMVVVKVYLLAG